MSITHTVDADGFVQSLVVNETKLCPGCKQHKLHSEFRTDARTKDKLSPTCKSCFKRGIRTFAEAELGRKISPWGNTAGSHQNKKEEPAPVVPAKKVETSEQKIIALLSLIVESLDSNERIILLRMLRSLEGGQ